jgi:hypothetical protein
MWVAAIVAILVIAGIAAYSYRGTQTASNPAATTSGQSTRAPASPPPASAPPASISPNSIGNSRATSRSADGHTLRYATIRWTTLGYLENVGFQFLSLRHDLGSWYSCNFYFFSWSNWSDISGALRHGVVAAGRAETILSANARRKYAFVSQPDFGGTDVSDIVAKLLAREVDSKERTGRTRAELEA